MRRPPNTRHLFAVLLFAAAAAVGGYLAMLETNLSPEQVDMAAAAVKRHDGSLFAHDPVFGKSELWRIHTPIFQGLLELMLVPTGYRDLTLPFRALAGVLLMVYLCGMYVLLYRQCRSWSVAAFVAVLSATVNYTPGDAHWGVGTLGSAGPAGICIAVTPLIVLAFLRYIPPAGRNDSREDRWRLLLVFGVIGLLGNLHLVSAMNLALVLLIAYLGRARFHPSGWPMAMGCALAAVVGALPSLGYVLMLRAALATAAGPPNAHVVHAALEEAGLAVFYPDLLKSAVNWTLYAAVLAIPAGAVLIRAERFRTRDLWLWVWMLGAGLFVAFALQGLSQLLGQLQATGPPTFAFAQASAFVMLPLYVLFAQALTSLFRIVRVHRWLVRWACAAVAAGLIIPSDNLRVPRRLLYDAATTFMAEGDKPLHVQELHAQREAQAELAAIADWARAAAPKDAVFITDHGKFRMLARRSIAASRSDASYFYYLRPSRLESWTRRLKAQQQLLRKPVTLADLAAFRHDAASEEGALAGAEAWFAILPADVAPDKARAAEVAGRDTWGQHYRVFRVPRSAPPATRAVAAGR